MRKEKSFNVHRPPMGEKPPEGLKNPPPLLIGVLAFMAFAIVAAVVAIAVLR